MFWNMSKQLRVAIVGCGKIADAHVEAIQNNPEAVLVGVCDREILMADQLASRFGLSNFYDDCDRMLATERPDVVHITTPPHSHLDLARISLNAGCHLFVEKPVAVDYAHTKALVDAAEAAQRKLTVGYMYLFDAAAVRLRELLHTGVLGDIVHIESFYGYDLQGPYATALLADPKHWVNALPGGLLQNVLDHLLNKIVEFLPEGEVQVQAVPLRRSAAAKADQSGLLVDELRMVMAAGGVSAYATFSANVRPMAHFVRVCGTKNTVKLDITTSTIHFERVPTLPSAVGRLVPPFQQTADSLRGAARNVSRFMRSEFHFFDGLNRLTQQFYRSIANDTEPPIPYSQILRVQLVLDEVIQQIGRAAA